MEKHHGGSVSLAFDMNLSWGFRSMFPCGAPEENTPRDWLRHNCCSSVSKNRASPLTRVKALLHSWAGRLQQQECQLLPSSHPRRKKRSSHLFPDQFALTAQESPWDRFTIRATVRLKGTVLSALEDEQAEAMLTLDNFWINSNQG